MPVEAADLVVLTQPWEARDGKRELLLVSPRGLARYWPDLRSPRRFTDVNARSATAGQLVRVFCFLFSSSFSFFRRHPIYYARVLRVTFPAHAGGVAGTWSQTALASTISTPSPLHAMYFYRMLG